MIKDAVIISLKVTFAGAALSLILGVLLARLVVAKAYVGRNILEILLMLPVCLPPSVIGYILLITMGNRGLLGGPLYKYFDIKILFTWQAAAIAAFIVSLPMVYHNTKAAFLDINPTLLDSARVSGANEWQVFWYLTLPLSIKGILSGFILAFGRAFGEFGATLMVAGNIPGKTQTVPMAIYYAVESGDFQTANLLVYIVISIVFTLIFIVNFILKNNEIY